MHIPGNTIERLSALAVLSVLALVAGSPAQAADELPQGFHERVLKEDGEKHEYVVFVPNDYTPDRRWPLILFLHGAGERGDDNRLQLQVGLGPFVKERAETFPYIVVFPQADKEGRRVTDWYADNPDGQRALQILEAVENEYNVNPDRRILTGWSMGGYGTWSLAAATPDKWAGIVPISGGGKTDWAEKLTDVPVWAFHGAEDKIVPVKESRAMVEAVREAGGDPRYSEIPDAGHDIWKIVYGGEAFYAWIANPGSREASTAALKVRPGERPAVEADVDQPFKPALEIPRAVYVRLGNDMLNALSYSVPDRVPQDVLSGWLDDIYDSTVAEGRTFNVTFSSISYDGELDRVKIRAVRDGRLRVQLGLRDLTISMGRTYVTGESRSAVAGPMHIVIGSDHPAWLSIDVAPYVRERRLRLRLLNTNFDIAGDNWYVTSPAGVSTEGLGMTEEKVSNGLVSGLYGSQGRIEREVESVVPSMIGRLEENLEIGETTDLAKSFWPLPVYKPRVRLWPQEVVTDDKGVSVVLGMTAAAIDPANAPSTPRRVDPVGAPAQEVPQSDKLQAGLSAEALRPLSTLLIEAGVARVHVRDIPNEAFAAFADREAMEKVIPDLKRYGEDLEIWAELILESPLGVQKAPETPESPELEVTDGGNSQKLEFSVSRAVISVAVRTGGDGEWKPCAEFDLQVSQNAEIALVRPAYEKRALQMSWFGEPQLDASGRFAPDYRPQDPRLDTKTFKTMFRKAWGDYTHKGPISEVAVEDIDFGSSELRVSRLGWSSPYLYAVFDNPGVKITNSSDQPLVYETKGPYSGWGGPYELQPGKSHEFDIPYALVYRQVSPGGRQVFTLPVGSHSEFREPRDGGAPQLFKAREPIAETLAAEEAETASER